MFETLFHVVLYQPEIPDNTGAVGRTCVAIGAKLWLVRPLGFQIDHRRIRRAGMDYWEHLHLEIVDDWECLTQCLADKRFWFLSTKAKRPYTAPAFEKCDVFVFGCESRGLPRTIMEDHRATLLKIPMNDEARSLNLSVSVGIMLYEAFRQLLPTI